MRKKEEKPRTYVLDPLEDARHAGRTAALRVSARAPGNEAIARQFYRWLKGRDLYEGKSIELEIPGRKSDGGDVTAIVTVAMDVTTFGHTTVHLSIPHAGKGHYDIYHYALYAVDAKNRRHAFPVPEEEEEEEEPFVRLSDFPEGERFSLSPPRRRQSHILDEDEDDVDIVIHEEEEPRYIVPLDVPLSREHEMFDEAFGELQDRVNDRRLSKKQRKANAKGMKRFREVHDMLADRERRREMNLEHDWVTENPRKLDGINKPSDFWNDTEHHRPRTSGEKPSADRGNTTMHWSSSGEPGPRNRDLPAEHLRRWMHTSGPFLTMGAAERVSAMPT